MIERKKEDYSDLKSPAGSILGVGEPGKDCVEGQLGLEELLGFEEQLGLEALHQD